MHSRPRQRQSKSFQDASNITRFLGQLKIRCFVDLPVCLNDPRSVQPNNEFSPTSVETNCQSILNFVYSFRVSKYTQDVLNVNTQSKYTYRSIRTFDPVQFFILCFLPLCKSSFI